MRRTALILILLFAAAVLHAQQIQVSGIVTDELGETVPGVGVVDKNAPSRATMTDTDGRYSILTTPDAFLEFSCIGYNTVVEHVDGRTELNITLKAAEDLSGDYTYTINRSDYGIVGLADSLFPENVSTTIHVGTQAVEGDVNGDNKVNISDVTYLINYLLTQGSTGAYMESADVNHDNKVNISDATYLINYLLTHQ